MIKIVPNRVVCDNCKVQLEYEHFDIKTIEHEENEMIMTIDKPIIVTFPTKKKIITCPNCKHVIYL